MYKTITLVILLSINQGLSAQTNLGSLFSVWQDRTKPDSTRVNAYRQFIWDGFIYSNPDSAIILAQAMLNYGENQKYLRANAIANNLIGVSFYIKSNYSKALTYFQLSLKIFEKLGDKKAIANTISNIGVIYRSQNNYPKAIEFYQRSLKIIEEIGNSKDIAGFLNNIGLIYQYQGDYIKSLEYLNRSLNIYQKIENKRGIALATGNIGSTYNFQGDYVKALYYFHKSLKISEDVGDKTNITNILTNIGLIYKIQGKLTKSLKYCEKSLSISKEIGLLDEELSACECLYETYKILGKENKALLYLEKIQDINDSLNNQETDKRLQQMEFEKKAFKDSIELEEEKRLVDKAHKDEVDKKNRTRNIAFGGIALVLLITVVLYSRLRYVRKSKAIIEKQKSEVEFQKTKIEEALYNLKETQGQLIQIENQKNLSLEKTRIARDMHDEIGSGLTQISMLSELIKSKSESNRDSGELEKLSIKTRELIQNMSQIIWAMNQDNNNLDNLLGYMRKFSMDFFENSSIECKVIIHGINEKLEITQSVRRNLLLVVKETFHNILKHSGAQRVNVEIKANDNLTITISENGKGFEPDAIKTFGNGLKNMEKRMGEIGGTFNLKSKTGQGSVTTLNLILGKKI